ncbi:MAG: M15 family peptidase [Flavobacteriales bacterium]|nr:M15 family peptidase [Flavobacteriales bacterium]
MPYNSQSILFAQGAMKRARIYDGPLDGVVNDAMVTALTKITEIKKSWPAARKVVAYLQKSAGLKGDDIDGLWGDQTEQAYNAMVQRRLFGEPEPVWRPESRVEVNPNNWPTQRTDAGLNAYYGAVGTNQKKLVPPYEHFLSWDPGKRVSSVSCNTKVYDSLGRVLADVLATYGAAEIKRLRLDQFGGSLNVRKMRGGDRYSMHSWGIALDYDPMNNQLKWGADKAAFARPEYAPWWECWEKEGWLSLGRTRNFDWMHVQAAKL